MPQSDRNWEAVFYEQKAEIEWLRTTLEDMIEITKRNSEAELMLIAIRKCAEHALSESLWQEK